MYKNVIIKGNLDWMNRRKRRNKAWIYERKYKLDGLKEKEE